jgi:hypothetical protein
MRRALDPPGAPRHMLHRRGGQTLYEAWAAADDLADGAFWYGLRLTATAAQQRGLTHGECCGRPIVPVAETTSS